MPWEGGGGPVPPSLPPLSPASTFCKVQFCLSLSLLLPPIQVPLSLAPLPTSSGMMWPSLGLYLSGGGGCILLLGCWSGHLGSDLPSLPPVCVACSSASQRLSCPSVKWPHALAVPGRQGRQLVCRRGVSTPAWVGVGPRAECWARKDPAAETRAGAFNCSEQIRTEGRLCLPLVWAP